MNNTAAVTETAPTIETDRARMAHLQERSQALGRDLAGARERLEKSETDLADARQAVVERAGGLARVRRLSAAVESLKATVQTYADALGRFDLEAGELQARVNAADRRIAQERAEAGAAPLRLEAAACEPALITDMLALGSHLEKRKAIADEVARRFPLAREIQPVTLDSLAVDLAAALKPCRLEHREVRLLFERVLAASVGDLVFKDDHLSRFGVAR
jgi:chromosome segregation ATPase